MSFAERCLILGGLLLFLVGLILGFVVHALPNTHGALAAHLNAVQSGTFVIVLGLCWQRLKLGARMSIVLAHATWMSFWGLEAGMILGAFIPPGQHPHGITTTMDPLLAVSAIIMTLAIAGAVVALFRRSQDSADAA